jgi:hypothetical protein
MTKALSVKAKRRIEDGLLLTVPSIVVIALFALAGLLSGCAQSPGGLNAAEGLALSRAVAIVVPPKVNTAVSNDLAVLSSNNVQAACGIIEVAQSYFDSVKPKVSTKALSIEAEAEQVVADICDNPPTDTASAINTLFKEWKVIRAASSSTKASS